ncbi:MAG: rhamnogalacturonan lyase [Sedimentisphaerales bacterium]|nr:rhamnogalacturonan lyase [Sedimentisphaerales bacterium]
MTKLKSVIYYVTIAIVFVLVTSASAQRQMEKLGRGLIAVNQGEGRAFISWRLLGTEPDGIAFNIYRTAGDGQPVRLNDQPMNKATCYQDSGVDFSQAVSYTVRAVLNGREQPDEGSVFKFPPNAPVRQYLSIPLKEGLVPNDASVGDLDGDGEYEIVLKREDRGRDNSQAGVTGETHLEAYKLDGTFMWRINLGRNIRSGAHYTQFMVFDLDSDGKAEIVCKTADGTVDGRGKVIGDPNANYVNNSGMILDGPEFLTVFEGPTGAALATADYNPPRGGNGSGWGDSNGNRVDRFLACAAYLDGVRPSVVMCRGYYTRATLAAWDWRDGKLTQRWFFDSADGGIAKDGKPNKAFEGQGNHNLSVADVDGDGRDEIVYGSCCIDDDGKGLYSTGLGHGDALHVSDLDPNRPGLEVFAIHERPRHPYGADLRDAASGRIIWGKPGIEGQNGPDTGRGLTADVDPRYPGAEFFAVGSHSAQGETIQVRGGNNFAIWWDGDLGREFLTSNQITKWNWETGQTERIFTAEGCSSNNGTKSTPALSADIFGDWREELIERTADNSELRIFTTVIPTEHRIFTLMHDPQYRQSIVWQNVAYNQPPWTSFFLGFDMKTPPKPNITTGPFK